MDLWRCKLRANNGATLGIQGWLFVVSRWYLVVGIWIVCRFQIYVLVVTAELFQLLNRLDSDDRLRDFSLRIFASGIWKMTGNTLGDNYWLLRMVSCQNSVGAVALL